MPTVVAGDFEWDADKAASNVAKHGVSFEEAATTFFDPHAMELDNGSPDGRLALIGYSEPARLLLVVFVERGERDRIISARRATGSERDRYEQGP